MNAAENALYIADELDRLAELTRQWLDAGDLDTQEDVHQHVTWLVEYLQGEVARKAQWGAE